MSTTENDDEAPSKGIELPESARRFHELYLADLARVEPVSDAQILAAIHRAEVHDEQEDASRADIAAHLGFVITRGRQSSSGHRSTHSGPLGESVTFGVVAWTCSR
jgi:hypothetical protein